LRELRAPFQCDVGSLQFFISFVGEEDRLRNEVFFLAYHLHWSVWDILDLPTEDRWAYVKLLSARLEEEHDAIEQARRHC
jgi:hypothetical protein